MEDRMTYEEWWALPSEEKKRLGGVPYCYVSDAVEDLMSVVLEYVGEAEHCGELMRSSGVMPQGFTERRRQEIRRRFSSYLQGVVEMEDDEEK